MEMRSETTVDITLFFMLVNQALQEYTGDQAYLFNPACFISDHAGANWRAIENVFGRETAVNKLVCALSSPSLIATLCCFGRSW